MALMKHEFIAQYVLAVANQPQYKDAYLSPVYRAIEIWELIEKHYDGPSIIYTGDDEAAIPINNFI